MSVPYIPPMTFEVLDVIFRHGVATTGHVRWMLAQRLSTQHVNATLRVLREGLRHGAGATPAPLIETARRRFSHFAASGGRWKSIHNLTPEGLRYVAECRDLHPRVAASLYSRAYREATVQHSLMRNDWEAGLAEAIETSADDERHEGIGFDTMCGESGLDPIPLWTPEGERRRYLNPDGKIELHKRGEPTFYVALYLESDTGSEDMRWQISRKAEQYAEHLSDLIKTGRSAPKVLFISPTVTRSRWVRQVFFETAKDEKTRLGREKKYFSERKIMKFTSLFVFTNLEWQRKHGALGTSYWSLTSAEPEPLF